MANWVYIENNEILHYFDRLPKSWKNISGLDLLESDSASLVSLGWFPVIKQEQSFDSNVSYLKEYTYEIHENSVTQIPVIVDYTEEELIKIHKKKKETFFEYLRTERNEKLSHSDWTQVLDIQNIHTEYQKTSWQTYRQQLRDLPQTYENATNFDVSSITWPQQPT